MARSIWKRFFRITFVAFINESLVGFSFLFMGMLIDNLVKGITQPDDYPFEYGVLLATVYSVSILLINMIRQNYELDNSLLFI